MTVRLAQISDTHLSRAKPFFLSNFDIVAADLAAQRPDLVINTGDLALDGADVEEDLVVAAQAHARLGFECHLLPGNHDVGDHLDVARRQPVNAERLERYRRLIGPDFWSLDLPGWRIVGLNALTLGSDVPGEAEQQAMVRTAAETLGGRALAVFLHKPLADQAHDETLSHSRFVTSSPRAVLLEALGDVRPALVCCGHVHQYRDTTFDGVRHVWAPATSFQISDPWQPVYGAKMVGYLMHEFDADGTHRHRVMAVRDLLHHDLADVPEAYGDVRHWGAGNA